MLNKILLRSSSGPEIRAGDRLFVRYEGQLLDGSIFDRNFDFSELEGVEGRDLFSFVLGQGQVIQGWELGFNGARLGQAFRLNIPAELAYGNISRPGIPANSELEFTIEIVGVNKGDKSTPTIYDLADVGIRLSKYGLSEASLRKISTGKIGLDIDENISGTPGPDLLTGLGGNNKITGGLGRDILISTTGADTFGYLELDDSQPGKRKRDLIAGFQKDDRIDLTGLAGEIEFEYIGRDRFNGVQGEIRFDRNVIGIDFNGDRKSEFEIELSAKTQITAESFLT